ncbi:phosphoinositide phosphatase sac6 [Phtheirospermum japonicum]|uniref:Phosphoinositide phosphatase sac6 n=1 Tax=Phtheirospermum japonicum TaxID=374723 RepID=A0A830D7F3_9LAMI|nr:phosphoinositide phosphatase sac6 [Phtheirospermum japonicum]
MRLWEFPDQYVLEPTDGSSAPFLAISRVDGSINLADDVTKFMKLHVPKVWTIFGVVGTLKLLAGMFYGSYLLVITERECVGSYLGYPIFKIISMKIFPCDHSLKNAPEEQKKMENDLSKLLSVAERTPGLYFSYDVNITLSIQQMHDLGDESKLLPLWRQLDPYLLPVMQGSFQSFKSAIGKDILDFTLIARRCTRRIGTRMWRRGADSDGFVANFVETEQIIQLNGYTASFIQVRGSIPLLWDQIVDLTYKPKFEIMELEEVPRVVERHFLDLRKKYGNILIVNLVNKHGGEGRLCEKFGSAVQHVASDDVRYLHFDFHRICGDNQIEWLSILYHRIETFLFQKRYFFLNDKGKKVEGQVGVVRTNCVDCLDRTNVTQSLIACKMLESQLRRLGVFNAEETISRHPNLDESFKNCQRGQRTVQGILKDSFTSLLRYYLNNFCDGTKQDAIDLLQGHYIVSVSQSMAPTTRKDGIEAIMSFQLTFLLIMTGFMCATVSLTRVQYDWWNLLFSIMWMSMSLAVLSVVRANGRAFCNRPRLHQPRH